MAGVKEPSTIPLRAGAKGRNAAKEEDFGYGWCKDMLTEKNTFLNIQSPDDQAPRLRRENSEPSLSSASSSCDDSSSRTRSYTRSGFLAAGGAVPKQEVTRVAAAEFAPTNDADHIVYETSDSTIGSGGQGSSEVGRDVQHWPGEVKQFGTTGGEPSSSSRPAVPKARLSKTSRTEGKKAPKEPNKFDSDEDDDDETFQFASLSGAEMEKLKARVPLDGDGNMTSIGSVAHAFGDCDPCDNLFSDGGCAKGFLCGKCHFKHSPDKEGAKCRRPCRAKRVRYQKLVNMVMNRIDEDPEGMDLNKLEIPPSIAADKALRERFLAKLQEYQEQAVIRIRGITIESQAARSDVRPTPNYPMKMSL